MSNPTIYETEALEVIFEGLSGKLSHEDNHRFPADIVTDTVFYKPQPTQVLYSAWAEAWEAESTSTA